MRIFLLTIRSGGSRWWLDGEFVGAVASPWRGSGAGPDDRERTPSGACRAVGGRQSKSNNVDKLTDPEKVITLTAKKSNTAPQSIKLTNEIGRAHV